MNIAELIHPEDAKALKGLKNIPALPQVMEKIFQYGYDEILWSENVTTNVRLSENQMPEIYNRLPPICERLGIPVPELYLQMSPIPNAWTSGHNKIYIVLTLGLIRKIKGEELDAVLAHECGHIVCQHVLYTTLANTIFTFGDSMTDSLLGVIGNVAMKPIRQALIAWSRASELSADRIACIITSAETLSRAFVRLDMVPKYIADTINLQAWAEQGKDFEALKNGTAWNKIVRWMSNSDADHPYNPVRAYQAMEWEKTSLCQQLKGTTCLQLESNKPTTPTMPSIPSKESVAATVSQVSDNIKDKVDGLAKGFGSLSKDVSKLTKDVKVGSVFSKFNLKK